MPDLKLIRIDFESAEATFSDDPAVALKGVKPDKIVENFDQRLRSASNHTFGIQPLITTPKDKLTRLEISVGGLDCKACCLAAYEALYKIEGVAQDAVLFKEGRIQTWIDPEKTNRAALEEALKKVGVQLKAP
jgi:hypothetical protein